jgi:hypothetical protein
MRVYVERMSMRVYVERRIVRDGVRERDTNIPNLRRGARYSDRRLSSYLFLRPAPAGIAHDMSLSVSRLRRTLRYH